MRVPGTLIAARRTSAEGSFAPNVVIRGFTRSGQFTIGRALGELQAFVAQQKDGEMEPPFEVEIAGVPFVGVNVSWADDTVGDVVQAHLFAGARRGQVVDLIQVTGSVGGPGRRGGVPRDPAGHADRPGRAVTATAMMLRAGAATDVGRVRKHNEDSVLAERSVFVVADGMGGPRGR